MAMPHTLISVFIPIRVQKARNSSLIVRLKQPMARVLACYASTSSMRKMKRVVMIIWSNRRNRVIIQKKSNSILVLHLVRTTSRHNYVTVNVILIIHIRALMLLGKPNSPLRKRKTSRFCLNKFPCYRIVYFSIFRIDGCLYNRIRDN